MENIIIRKPNFMRDEASMTTWVMVAESISKEMNKPDLTLEMKDALLVRFGYCLSEAAKAGGFFSTKDFCRWMNKRAHIT